MGKIGFNCQLLLSEIGLTTDSSHSTWFHKTIRFSLSKASSEEDLAQHVLFDTSRRRTRLGILKKIEESEPSQDDTDQPLLLAPKILPLPPSSESKVFYEFFIFEFQNIILCLPCCLKTIFAEKQKLCTKKLNEQINQMYFISITCIYIHSFSIFFA